jgi:hypothetical protein
MRLTIRLLSILAVLLWSAGAGYSAGRVALVIGNGSYEGATKLANPVNDAEDVAAKLKELGFLVVEGYDLGKREMEQKIGEFSDRLEGADAGVFYYAGHGIAVSGRNFIVPTDANLSAPAKLKFESISIDDLVELMKAMAPVNILVLDACRNNPFARGTSVTSRGASEESGGLAVSNSYAGAYTVYSAQDGAVALDGEGRNSPFALALLKHIGTPGAPIETVMGAVKADVEAATKGFQSPDAKGLLVQSFSFAPGQQMATRSVEPGNGGAQDQPSNAAAGEIESVVKSRYLKPDAGNLASFVEALYSDPVTSFGRTVPRSELLDAKAKWFGDFAKWRLSMLPGTFKAEFADEETARVTFDLRYKYWYKDTTRQPIAGTVNVFLDMVKEDGTWKIEMENSRLAASGETQE